MTIQFRKKEIECTCNNCLPAVMSSAKSLFEEGIIIRKFESRLPRKGGYI